MRLTFLGTGASQGVPVIACPCPVCQSADGHDRRLRTSALIEGNGVNILIDIGPDFRQQMLAAQVTNLHGVLITHEHRDHIAGMDDVRAFNWVHQRPMDVWVEPRVGDALRKEMRYIFDPEKYPGAPEVRLQTIDGKPFRIMGVEVIPIRAYHHQLPIYGFRMGGLAYITDANRIEEEAKAKLTGLEYLIINALRPQGHISHFSLAQALQLIAELRPHRAYLTHISHQMGLHAEVSGTLPEHVMLAYDGLSVEY